MKTRSIGEDFFFNEHLAGLPIATRLLFAGLWCMADRDGRLEDRPRRIRAELFPYDTDFDIERSLEELNSCGLIKRYQAFEGVEGDTIKAIQVCNWRFWQQPHRAEARSKISPLTDDETELDKWRLHLKAPVYKDLEWRRLCVRMGGSCLACGSTEKLTKDHIIPLSQGGLDILENLQPLCQPCNSRKHKKTIDYRKPHHLKAVK